MSALGIRTIVVATDLTDTLLPALRSAARLAELTEADLHVVHTTEKRISESLLDDHLRAAGLAGAPRVTAQIMVGPPGALITQEAARLSADVIVLGPHRPNQTRLGSTAYRVMHGSHTPCLVLPLALSLPLQKVLVPLDLFEPARGALAVAITWASALRRREPGETTTLTALHVLTANQVQGSDSTSRVTDEAARVRRQFGNVVGLAIESVVDSGIPATVILQHAKTLNADLIVMGTRGQHPETAELGSVALAVVKRAERPALLVPPGTWRNS